MVDVPLACLMTWGSKTSTGWWFQPYPSQKYEFVNWDHWLFATCGKIENVPNHQPVDHLQVWSLDHQKTMGSRTTLVMWIRLYSEEPAGSWHNRSWGTSTALEGAEVCWGFGEQHGIRYCTHLYTVDQYAMCNDSIIVILRMFAGHYGQYFMCVWYIPLNNCWFIPPSFVVESHCS